MATTVHSTNPFISNDDDQQHQLEDEEEEEDEEVESDGLDHTQVQDPQQRLLLNHHHQLQHLHHRFHNHHLAPHHHQHDSITIATCEVRTFCTSSMLETATNAPNTAEGFTAVSETVIKVPSTTSGYQLDNESSKEEPRQQATDSAPESILQFNLVENNALENLELPAENGAQELGNTGSSQPKNQPDQDQNQASDGDQGDKEEYDEEQDEEEEDGDDDGVEDEEEDDDDDEDDDDEDAEDDDDEDDEDNDETSDESEIEQIVEPGQNNDFIHQQSSILNHNNSNNNNNNLPCHLEIQPHQYPNSHSTLHHVHFTNPPSPAPAPQHHQPQTQHLLHHHIHPTAPPTSHEFHLHQHHQELPLHDTSNHPNLLQLQRTTSATIDIVPTVVTTANDSMQTSNCADLMDDNLICESNFCVDSSFRLAHDQNNFIVNNYEDDGIHDNDTIQDENGDYEDDEEDDDEFESDDVDEDCIINDDKHSFPQHHQLQTNNNIHCLNQRLQQDDNDILDGERMLEVTRKLVRNTERDPDRDLRKQVLLKTAIKKLPHYMDYNHYNVDCLDQNLHAENFATQNYYDHHHHHHQIQQHHHLHQNLNHNHNMIDPQTQKSSFYHSVQPNAIQMSTTSLRMLDLNDDHEPDANSNVTQSSNKRSSSSTELSTHCPSFGSNNQYKKLRRKEIID